jgi:hypothetical protein
MAVKKLIVKSAVPNPKKGEFYYIKDGSIYATTPNRKGGKKGRKTCTASKPTVKKAAKKKPVKKATKKAAPRRVVKKVAPKKTIRKRVVKRAAPKKTVRKKTTKK